MTDAARSGSENAIVVVVATDDRYAMPTAVTLRSIIDATPGPVRFAVLHDALPILTQERVTKSLTPGAWNIEWIDLSRHDIGHLSRDLPAASNFRLLIDEVVAPTSPRLLYLDVDVLVRRDLRPLFDMDMQGRTVAAIRSVNYPNVGTWGAIDNWRQLNLDPRAPFFNGGVLLIDCAQWLEREVSRRCLDYLRSPLARAVIADQEALNVVLQGDWLEIDPVWNQQTPMLDHRRGAALVFTDEQLAGALEDPAVVHFLDRPKPWARGCTHPRRGEWLDLAEETAFAPVRLSKRRLRDEVRRRVKRAASALVRGT